MKTRHAFITAQAAAYPVSVLYRVLGISRNWYQARALRPDADRPESDREGMGHRLLDEIKRIFKDSHKTYGAPRIHAELREGGWKVSRKKIAKIMKDNDISPQRRKARKPVTTNSKHNNLISPNILGRQFNITKPNTAWVVDITYCRTDKGWLYLAAMKDRATCEIVGWSMDNNAPRSGCIHPWQRGLCSWPFNVIIRRKV